jgi:hypothetical protein
MSYAGQYTDPDLLFVVGGNQKLFWLWKTKRKKIPIVYTLDGIGWLHKKGDVKLKK